MGPRAAPLAQFGAFEPKLNSHWITTCSQVNVYREVATGHHSVLVVVRQLRTGVRGIMPFRSHPDLCDPDSDFLRPGIHPDFDLAD